MNGLKILIVEDEGVEALDIQERLINLGYDVPDIAVNGEEAIKKAEEIQPNLVLMDIMLHGEIDGVMAAEKIHTYLDVPVIYLTAYADENTLQRAKITEPYGYIVKPFQERELHITIDMALYKHKMEKQIKEREKWFGTTIKSIGDAVIATDQNGLVTFMNGVAEDLTGWSMNEALNKRLTEIFNIINSHTGEPAVNPAARVILEGITVGLANHTVLISKTGNHIPIDDSAAPIKDDKGNLIGVVLVFRDITARQQAEDALRQARNELETRVIERTAQLIETVKALEEEVSRRTAVENALRVSEGAVEIERKRLNDILELLPAYLILLTPDYHVPFANRFFRERFGESNGRRCFDYLFGRCESCEPCETYKVLKTMTPLEWEWTGPDGRIYQIFDFPFADTDGSTLIMEMGIDITERKQAEEAIRIASVYNRNLIEASLDPLVTIGPDGTITDVNAATEIVTGYTRKELIGTDFSEYFSEPDKARAGYQQVFQEGLTRDYALEIRHRDGHFTPVLYNASVYRDDDGCVIGVFAAARDITERKRAEIELVKYRQHLEELVQERTRKLEIANVRLQAEISERKKAEAALQVKQEELTAVNEELQAQQEELIFVNEELQTQTAELNVAYLELQRRAAELDATISAIMTGIIIYDNLGNIVRINEVARSIFGLSGDKFDLNYPKLEIDLNLCKYDGTPYAAVDRPLYRALRGEIVRDEEMMISDKPVWLSGTLAPIRDNKNKLVGVIFIFTDITERKRKVEDLLASERELLKVTLNSLCEGVIATDQEEYIILINEAAVNLTGFFQHEAINKPLEKVLYILDDKTSEPILATASQRIGNPILVTKDLREIPIALNRSPIKTTDGQIIGTVTVFQDISAKQKTERELLKADKLESLGILAGGIAHDFNNVLAAILSNIQLAMRKLEKDQDIKNYLVNTIETTRKASELTKQLLTFSKGGAPVRKDASLIELIKDTSEFALRGSKTKAEYNIPDNLWVASVDEGQISQVIHNLVINAKQAMPKGGIIQISAENIVKGDDIRYNPGNYVKITVKDQGTGITKANLSKVFDPFFTTKKDGNGLGLATSYSIIIRHNGYIEVESQPGSGTTFIILLPASAAIIAESKNNAREITVNKAGIKILFMDDEVKILQAVGEMLRECFGYQVVLATDGTQAMELYKQAKNKGEPFDVVITDLTVPGGMGGQETIAHLRDFDPQIKAIVSSGYANDPIMADYERYGFIGVVSKPYKIDELNKILQTVTIPSDGMVK